MPKVLFACTQIHSHGGVQRFNRNLVNAWVELGADVDIVSVNDPVDASYPGLSEKGTRRFYAGRNKRRWLGHLARLMSSGPYDAYVCGHINLIAAFSLVMLLARRSFAGSSLILHGIETWGHVKGAKKVAASRIACILGVSRYTVRNFIEQMGTFPENRTTVFPNTLNPDLTKRIPDLSRRIAVERRLRLLSVTRLDKSERDKGLVHVISALSRLANQVDFQYEIVGAGNDLSYLETVAKDAGIADRVHFKGALSDDALWEAYENADVFVLPSRKEGFGIVFLEAMYFSLPVIGAAEKGALDVIQHGINGFAIDYGNVDQLEKYLNELACHPEVRKEMARNGHELVAAGGQYSFEAFRERTYRCFLAQK